MTSNDALVQRFQALEVKNTEAMGDLRGDIKLLTSEVKRLNDTLSSTAQLMATKEDLASAKAHSELEHQNMKKDIKDLQDWNKWALRIIVGAVLVAVVGTVVVTKVG